MDQSARGGPGRSLSRFPKAFISDSVERASRPIVPQTFLADADDGLKDRAPLAAFLLTATTPVSTRKEPHVAQRKPETTISPARVGKNSHARPARHRTHLLTLTSGIP